MSNPGLHGLNEPTVRDPWALQRWKAEQLRAERQRNATLSPEEFIRARDDMRIRNRAAAIAKRRQAALDYYARIDKAVAIRDRKSAEAEEFARVLKIRKAKQQQAAYVLRAASEKLTEADALHAKVVALEEEIAALHELAQEGVFD